MKKMLNRSFLAVLAAALVTAALVTCASPVDGTSLSEGGGGGNTQVQTYNPPAGMGYIRINLTKNNSRTILPDLPDENNLYYRFLITDDYSVPVGNVVYDSNNYNGGNAIKLAALTTTPITVIPGTYTVTVTAYTSAAKTNPVGEGEDAGVVVSNGTGGTATVELLPYVTDPDPSTNNYSGTFSYNITLPSNINKSQGVFTAVLDVKAYATDDYTGVPSALQIHSLIGTGNNTNGTGVSLPVGIYLVTITMNDPGTTGPTVPPALQSRTVTNIMHIYRNIETPWTPSLPDLNEFNYTVTYNTQGGSTAPGPVTNVYHGSTLTDPGDPTKSSYIFGYWSWANTPSSSPVKKWVFGSSGTKVVGNLTLYAIWEEAEDLGVSISWAGNGDPVITPDSHTFHRFEYYAGVDQSVTITPSIPVGWSLKEWFMKGVRYPASTPISIAAVNVIDYLPGDLVITLIIAKTGEPDRSVDFTLSVIN